MYINAETATGIFLVLWLGGTFIAVFVEIYLQARRNRNKE